MDEGRVAHLLQALRQRGSEDVTVSVLALAGSLTPEMWRALALFRKEQRGEASDDDPGKTPQAETLPRSDK